MCEAFQLVGVMWRLNESFELWLWSREGETIISNSLPLFWLVFDVSYGVNYCNFISPHLL